MVQMDIVEWRFCLLPQKWDRILLMYILGVIDNPLVA